MSVFYNEVKLLPCLKTQETPRGNEDPRSLLEEPPVVLAIFRGNFMFSCFLAFFITRLDRTYPTHSAYQTAPPPTNRPTAANKTHRWGPRRGSSRERGHLAKGGRDTSQGGCLSHLVRELKFLPQIVFLLKDLSV